MKKLLRIAALLFSLVPFASSAVAARPVSSIIVMPWDLSQNKNLPGELKSRGFSHATVYLNWSDIERNKGLYDFSHYHGHMDALVGGGLSLLLVIDMGGRPYKDESGKLVPDMSTVPQWITAAHPDAVMRNFSGDPSWQPDFTDERIRKPAHAFIAQTVDHFSRRYPAKVLGYAIGLQEEHEIKYGQMGYQWRDYKESTQNDFARKHNNARQPVINYNNNIAAGVPKAEPLLHAHKEFRENRLQEATCAYTKVIRDKGAQAIGYFAETFTSHDAIYATGIVEKMAECIDIAVIDFNFYDGYSLVPDADVLPTLANYMGSLGYKKIMVGAYGERWEAEKRSRELMPVIQRSVTQSLTQAHVMGYEIGGFAHQAGGGSLSALDMNKLNAPSGHIAATSTAPRIKIGILGSTTNFHVWHGERSAGRNTHRDALFASYKILSSEPGMDVHVIGEKNLLQDDPLIQRLDAILVPHQAALPQSVKSKLTTYWKNGGSLIQDMRLGEFDENGKPTFDWMHEVFGIADIEWKKNGGIFLIDGAIYRLKPSRRLYAGYAAITPKNGFKVLATELLRNDKGIMVRGERTLAFGFLPQLVEDHTGDAWRKLFVKEIMNTLPSRKTAAAERQ
jgi:beta-galactosidase